MNKKVQVERSKKLDKIRKEHGFTSFSAHEIPEYAESLESTVIKLQSKNTKLRAVLNQVITNYDKEGDPVLHDYWNYTIDQARELVGLLNEGEIPTKT